MDNLLASTEVHTVFLDRDLAIRKFTPRIAEEFNLLPQDLGRRIDNFTHHIRFEPLMEELRRVLETAVAVRARGAGPPRPSGSCCGSCLIAPGGSVAGVVLTLIHIDSLKRAEARAGRTNGNWPGSWRTRPPWWPSRTSTAATCSMNRAFRTLLRLSDDEVAGKSDYDLFLPIWPSTHGQRPQGRPPRA